MIKIFFIIDLIMCPYGFSSEVYKFKSVNDEDRFYALIHEIRCPKCTSGSIASSNAPVSEDLKMKIAELINQGYSDAEIKDYAKKRFGKDILYDPEINSTTFVLWFGPFIFLTLILFGFLLRRKFK